MMSKFSLLIRIQCSSFFSKFGKYVCLNYTLNDDQVAYSSFVIIVQIHCLFMNADIYSNYNIHNGLYFNKLTQNVNLILIYYLTFIVIGKCDLMSIVQWLPVINLMSNLLSLVEACIDGVW